MFKRIVILNFLFLLKSSTILSQDFVNASPVFVNDAQLWAGLSFEKKINKTFTPHIKGLIRQGENFRLFKQYYIDGGVDVNINAKLKFTFDYVYTPSRKDFSQSLIPYHQYYCTLSFKQKINQRFIFDNKTTLQETSSFLFQYNDYKLKDVLVIRDKVILRCKISRRNMVYLADEVLYPLLNTPDHYLRRNRIFVGLVHKINKHLDVDTYFLLQRYYNSKAPLFSDYVYGINFDYFFMGKLYFV